MMKGLGAISSANGWEITLVGMSVVFTGLVLLTLCVANMERLLGLWDRRPGLRSLWKRAPRPSEAGAPTPAATDFPGEPEPTRPGMTLTEEQQEVMQYFKFITERLGEPFSLPRLLEQAVNRGISKPHSHLAAFLEQEMIVEGDGQERGFYRWRSREQHSSE